MHEPARSDAMLERNLRALAGAGLGRSAEAIARIRAARADGVRLTVAADGGLTGVGADGRRLASAHGPRVEGERFARGVDIARAAAIVVRGFGVGHHVEALSRRVKFAGAVLVYEPDAALLRAVFERVDCSEWLRMANIAIVTDAGSSGAIAAATQSIEGILAAGTQIVDHPPSRARLAATADAFGEQFANVMKAVRTTVVTTLVQVDVTVRNCLQNAEWYASCPGVADLLGAAKGRPAVVVSAGPSLRRNIDLLCDPAVRSRVVIVAAQTVLKTLLAKGIRPHFVTALDYHEISRRFYEGLTEEDVRGVTLVAEAKCNPAILEAWPGQIRLVGDHVLDRVLGPTLRREMGEIPPGATVAHLSYYLARHLGCDPVMLVGQDLGFTDGQYYGPGAAIHQVWSGELNEFNTIEMLEWQRIARMRGMLRKVPDQQGRTIYTDEQMATYLVQFERDFGKDAERGLTVIDATEGGVLKQHTRVMTLADALAAHARPVPRAADEPERSLEGLRVAPERAAGKAGALRARLRTLRGDCTRLSRLGRETAGLLSEMKAHHREQDRVNRLIAKVQRHATTAADLSCYWLVQYVNQTGQLNRFRADRTIAIDDTLTPMEKQARQIERDLRNVRWLADVADHTGALLDEAITALDRGVRVTRDQTPDAERQGDARAARRSVWACVPVDGAGWSGTVGSGADRASGDRALVRTLGRLALSRETDGVLLIGDVSGDALASLRSAAPGLRIDAAASPNDDPARRRAVMVGRAWSRHCWRGGLADLSCYDEVLSPRSLAPILEARGIDAAVLVGAGWCLVDPALTDAVIARHRERPDAHTITFTQAPPGLAPCLIARGAVRELADAPSAFATIGGLLGYIPIAPQADPIVKPVCVQVPAAVRDCLRRFIADDRAGAALIDGFVRARGEGWKGTTAADVVAWADDEGRAVIGAPEMVEIDGGIDDAALAGVTAYLSVNKDQVSVTVRVTGEQTDRLARLLSGLGDARAVHVRVRDLTADATDRLLASGAGVISVDCVADDAATYAVLTGGAAGRAAGDFDAMRAAVDRLIEARAEHGGLPTPWIVPRLTRRDAVREQIEGFYNRSLLTAGACVIDALSGAMPGERIGPFPAPASVRARLRWSLVRVDAAGRVTNGLGEAIDAPWARRDAA